MVSVQGAFPHSTACQSRYLSASNRGTGEDRQHLLSKPNYLLSTKQEGEAAPQPRPSPCGHTHTHTHSSLSSGHYGSLRRRRAAVIFIYFFPNSFIALWQFFFFFFSEQMREGKVQHSWSWCWIRENTSSAAVVPDSFMMEVEEEEEEGVVGGCVCGEGWGAVWSCRSHRNLPGLPGGKLCPCVGGHRITTSQHMAP